jgi:murein DD-endopeptidase MepM/ murein hydrolase activator NlpD
MLCDYNYLASVYYLASTVVRLFLKLDRYNFLLFGTIALSLTYNVIVTDEIKNSGNNFLEGMLYNNTGVNTKQADLGAAIEESGSSDYTRVKKEDNTHSLILEEGDNLSEVLKEMGITNSITASIVKSVEKVYSAKKLKPGDEVQLIFNKRQINSLVPEKFILETSTHKIQSERLSDSDQYLAKIDNLALDTKVSYSSGKIIGNFFKSAKNSGLHSSLILDFINIFSHQIDFQKDIDNQSHFKVIYEHKQNGKRSGFKNSKILYAALRTKGKNKELYINESPDGSFAYFDKDGISAKKILLRNPVKRCIISSGFGPRVHPILGYSRMHRGQDYAAPRGTPVLASGDGTIEVMRYHNSYGYYIKIKHNKKYSTLYAHLSKFAPRFATGSIVKQGDVIGYVGATGMATGPHLHYEVHIDGKQVNPIKISSLNKTTVLKGSALKSFKRKQEEILKILNNDIVLNDFKS